MAFKIVNEAKVRTWVDPLDPEVKLRYVVKSPGRFLEMHERMEASAAKAGAGQVARKFAYLRGFAEEVVVGWEGVIDEDGQPVPWSPDVSVAAVELLARFIEDVVEDVMRRALGNSSGASASSSSRVGETSTPAVGN